MFCIKCSAYIRYKSRTGNCRSCEAKELYRLRVLKESTEAIKKELRDLISEEYNDQGIRPVDRIIKEYGDNYYTIQQACMVLNLSKIAVRNRFKAYMIKVPYTENRDIYLIPKEVVDNERGKR